MGINGRKTTGFQYGCMKAVLSVIVCFMCIGIFLPVSAQAVDDSSIKKVRVGLFDAGRMMAGIESNEHKTGYAYEYLQEFSLHTGWRYEYVSGKFEDILAMLIRGEVDIVPMLSRTEERLSKIFYPEQPFGMEHFFLATTQERATEFDGDFNKKLEGKRIGVDAGYAENRFLRKYLADNNIKAEIISFDTTTKKINAVRKGKADMMLASNNAVPDDFALLQSMGSMPCYIGISLKRPDILEDMNRAQQQINLNRPDFEGYLVKKYFSKDPINKRLTAEEKNWLGEHSVLKIGAYSSDYPYSFSTADNKVVGVMPDAVGRMLERLNLPLKPEWKLYDTRKELIKALHSGEVDL